MAEGSEDLGRKLEHRGGKSQVCGGFIEKCISTTGVLSLASRQSPCTVAAMRCVAKPHGLAHAERSTKPCIVNLNFIGKCKSELVDR